jgi:hypothetical protein
MVPDSHELQDESGNFSEAKLKSDSFCQLLIWESLRQALTDNCSGHVEFIEIFENFTGILNGKKN